MDFATWLPDDILVKADRMSMAHGLEVRVPLLDTDFVTWAAGLPGAARCPPPHQDPAARAAGAARPAHGAGARQAGLPPAGRRVAARAPLRGYTEELLFAPSALGARLLDRRALRAFWEAHLSRRANHQHGLWMLLMLESWHRRHARRAQESVR